MHRNLYPCQLNFVQQQYGDEIRLSYYAPIHQFLLYYKRTTESQKWSNG